MVNQFPDNSLTNELPDRPRSWKILLHHVFQIPKSFLDREETNQDYTYEMMTEAPSENFKTVEDITEFGKETSKRFYAWWKKSKYDDFSKPVPTYFGETSKHELLERTVWHTTQHVRQIQFLLESLNIQTHDTISLEQLGGLPLTEAILD